MSGTPVISTALMPESDQQLMINLYAGSVIEDVNVWLNVLDNNFNIVLWNAAAERMSGYTRSEVLGHNRIWEWLYPEAAYRASIIALVNDMFASGRQIINFETLLRCKSGELRNILWNSKYLVDDQGVRFGAITFGYDVTEQQRARAALQQAHNDLSVLYDVVSVASASIDLDEILNRALERVLFAMGCTKGVIHLLDHDVESFVLTAQSGLSAAAAAQFAQIAPDDQLIGRVARLAEPLAAPFLADEIVDFQSLPARLLHSYLGVPLRAKGRVLGVFSVLGKAGRVFRSDEIALLSSIADQVGVAIANARLYQQARQAAVLDERRRLARDLHDSVAQTLYSMTLYAETGRRMLQRQDAAAAELYLDRLHDTSLRALKEMRLLLYELRPFGLDQDGLIAALQQRLDAVERRAGVRAELLVDGSGALPVAAERDLYHIIQEALNNALRHAGATEVVISLQLTSPQIVVRVSDNGRGFDAGGVALHGGLGLTSMRERTEELGGWLEIQSAIGAGTTVLVQIDRAALPALWNAEGKRL